MEYNEANVKRLEKKINGMSDIDICHENNPKMPVLVSLPRLHAYSIRYRRYMTLNPLIIEESKIEKDCWAYNASNYVLIEMDFLLINYYSF